MTSEPCECQTRDQHAGLPHSVVAALTVRVSRASAFRGRREWLTTQSFLSFPSTCPVDGTEPDVPSGAPCLWRLRRRLRSWRCRNRGVFGASKDLDGRTWHGGGACRVCWWAPLVTDSAPSARPRGVVHHRNSISGNICADIRKVGLLRQSYRRSSSLSKSRVLRLLLPEGAGTRTAKWQCWSPRQLSSAASSLWNLFASEVSQKKSKSHLVCSSSGQLSAPSTVSVIDFMSSTIRFAPGTDRLSILEEDVPEHGRQHLSVVSAAQGIALATTMSASTWLLSGLWQGARTCALSLWTMSGR